MVILKVAVGQVVQIPELPTESGACFVGRVKSHVKETILVEPGPGMAVKPLGRRGERLLTMTWNHDGGEQTCSILVRQVRPGEVVCQMVIDERRQSVRARCDLEVFFNVIEPTRLNEVAEAVLARISPAAEPEKSIESLLRPEIEDDALRVELTVMRGMIERLTHQVERLMQIVQDGKEEPNGRENKALDVNDCSATGVSFRYNSQLVIGTLMKLRLVFNSLPKIAFDSVGVVVRTESRTTQARHPEHYDIGVRFTHIHEADREAIVRHIFKVQRNQLRNRSLSAR